MSRTTAPDIARDGSTVARQIRIVVFLLSLVLLMGVVGYTTIEGWTALESLYMTVITITTIGFKEVRDLSDAGRVFTIVLIVCGVGTWAYAAGSFSGLLVEGDVKRFFARRRLRHMLHAMANHTIVCGFGRIGRIVAHELAIEKTPFIVVEKSPAHQQELERLGYVYVTGDATQEDVLRGAGIASARCLISALGTDASNVYTVLIARDLNPRLHIIGRSEDETAEDKILRAGADKVISPYRIGAQGLVQAAVRPHVLNFIEVATSTSSLELAIEEMEVVEKAPLAGKTLAGARIRERFGIIVVGSRKGNREMVFNPPADYPIQPGEVLIAMGKRDQLKAFRQAVGASAA